MSHERKVDVSGIWGRRPSADIAETQNAQRGPRVPARTPLVNINHIERSSVINIANVTGLDLAALVGDPRDSRP